MFAIWKFLRSLFKIINGQAALAVLIAALGALLLHYHYSLTAMGSPRLDYGLSGSADCAATLARSSCLRCV